MSVELASSAGFIASIGKKQIHYLASAGGNLYHNGILGKSDYQFYMQVFATDKNGQSFELNRNPGIKPEDAKIIPALKHIMERGGIIVEIPGSKLEGLADKVPLLESPNGSLHYGPGAIESYARQY